MSVLVLQAPVAKRLTRRSAKPVSAGSIPARRSSIAHHYVRKCDRLFPPSCSVHIAVKSALPIAPPTTTICLIFIHRRQPVPEEVVRASLTEQAAYQLSNVTKSAPQYGVITPRWLVRLLDWKPLEAGSFRLNKVDEDKIVESTCGHEDESPLASTYIAYQ